MSILIEPRVRLWRRLATAAAWGAAIAIGTASVLSALLGRGRVSDVISPEGALILTWCAATAVAFAAFGTLAHRLGLWIDVR